MLGHQEKLVMFFLQRLEGVRGGRPHPQLDPLALRETIFVQDYAGD